MGRGLVVLARAGAIATWPGAAGAATVSFDPAHSEVDPTTDEQEPIEGDVEVRDGARQDNDIEIRTTKRRVTMVEHGRPHLRAGRNCHARTSHEVFCRARYPDNWVFVEAGRGRDTVRGHCDQSGLSIVGGPGDDRLFQGGCGGPIWGGQGDDLLVGDASGQYLRGGGGDDRLRGRGGDDLLYGDGSDKHPGDDSIDGGAGRDTAVWDEREHDIRADLRSGIEQSPVDRDRLRGIENLVGGYGDDTLAGDGKRNVLRGARGVDELIGRGGNDTLDGGGGSPTHTSVADDSPDYFSCGDGRDLILFPGHTVLPWGCERMQGGYDEFFDDPIRIRPKPAGPHAVDVPVLCDPTSPACRRRVTISAGDTVLGRTDLVPDPPLEMRVELKRAAPRNTPVTIVVTGDDEDSDVTSDGELVPYRFKWRVGCDGTPRRDVCRIGAR